MDVILHNILRSPLDTREWCEYPVISAACGQKKESRPARGGFLMLTGRGIHTVLAAPATDEANNSVTLLRRPPPVKSISADPTGLPRKDWYVSNTTAPRRGVDRGSTPAA